MATQIMLFEIATTRTADGEGVELRRGKPLIGDLTVYQARVILGRGNPAAVGRRRIDEAVRAGKLRVSRSPGTKRKDGKRPNTQMLLNGDDVYALKAAWDAAGKSR